MDKIRVQIYVGESDLFDIDTIVLEKKKKDRKYSRNEFISEALKKAIKEEKK